MAYTVYPFPCNANGVIRIAPSALKLWISKNKRIQTSAFDNSSQIIDLSSSRWNTAITMGTLTHEESRELFGFFSKVDAGSGLFSVYDTTHPAPYGDIEDIDVTAHFFNQYSWVASENTMVYAIDVRDYTSSGDHVYGDIAISSGSMLVLNFFDESTKPGMSTGDQILKPGDYVSLDLGNGLFSTHVVSSGVSLTKTYAEDFSVFYPAVSYENGFIKETSEVTILNCGSVTNESGTFNFSYAGMIITPPLRIDPEINADYSSAAVSFTRCPIVFQMKQDQQYVMSQTDGKFDNVTIEAEEFIPQAGL